MDRQMGDAQDAAAAPHAGAGAALQGRRYKMPRPGPRLLHADLPRVTLSTTEIIRETRGRERSADRPADEYAEAASLLVGYRIYSLEIMRRPQKDARNMFLRDLGEVERRPFPEMQLLLQILAHFPPRQLRARPNAKDPPYEELVIPDRLRVFEASLSGIGSLPKPTQEMANYISLGLDRGRI